MPLPLGRLGLFSSFYLAVFTAALSGMLVNNNSTSKDTLISFLNHSVTEGRYKEG